MEKVKICYSERANIGDAINPYIIRNVLGYEPVRTDAYHCQITGIGSGLRRFFVGDRSDGKKPDIKQIVRNQRNRIKKRIYGDPVILWSAGFLSTPTDKEYIIKKDIKVASVRGELSRRHVEAILHKSIDCTTGDGGLLCSKWIPANGKKCYRLGIIPHVKEKSELLFQQIKEMYDDSIIIDVEDDPVKNLKIISSCECIISSSLHGLIISDSYCVPNKHVILTNKLAGDGFKFGDYYSSFGFTDEPQNLNTNSKIDMNSIISNYRFTKDLIERKQADIIAAFSIYL